MTKDYKKWFKLKPIINETQLPLNFHVDIGEIWLCSLGENIGIEINGKGDDYLRPVLIIKIFNRNHVWILPLTTNKKVNKFYADIPSFSSSSVVLSQLHTISSNRFYRFIAKINDSDLFKINQSLIDLLKTKPPHQVGESHGR